MISESEIVKIVNDNLKGTSKFLVEVKILTGNRIIVFIDGDNGISIDDCILLSKHIESKLSREIEDYSLDVSSSGLTSPIRLLRQYNKFIGKQLEILTLDGEKQTGILVSYSEDNIEIRSHKIINPKTKTSSSIVDNNVLIPFKIIKEVKPVISFK